MEDGQIGTVKFVDHNKDERVAVQLYVTFLCFVFIYPVHNMNTNEYFLQNKYSKKIGGKGKNIMTVLVCILFLINLISRVLCYFYYIVLGKLRWHNSYRTLD